MITLANINYFEPWWIQIVKSILIFAVIFGILPIPEPVEPEAEAAKPDTPAVEEAVV